jgi:hypothetical protein
MVELDDWIPNFDLFVMTILPAILAITIAVILIDFWVKRGARDRGGEFVWMDILIWMTAVYFVIPAWRVIQYLMGEKSFSVLVEELFIDDFYNYMVLLLMVGIVGAVYIFLAKLRSWEVKG